MSFTNIGLCSLELSRNVLSRPASETKDDAVERLARINMVAAKALPHSLGTGIWTPRGSGEHVCRSQ